MKKEKENYKKWCTVCLRLHHAWISKHTSPSEIFSNFSKPVLATSLNFQVFPFLNNWHWIRKFLLYFSRSHCFLNFIRIIYMNFEGRNSFIFNVFCIRFFLYQNTNTWYSTLMHIHRNIFTYILNKLKMKAYMYCIEFFAKQFEFHWLILNFHIYLKIY